MYRGNIIHRTLTNQTVILPVPMPILCPATTGIRFTTQKIYVHWAEP